MRFPCLKLLFPIVFPYNPPFIAILYLVVVIRAIIHFMNLWGKFIAWSIFSTNDHSTLSYSFLKSILIKQLWVVFFLLYSLTKSWHINTFCIVVLPAMNILLLEKINVYCISLNLLHNILDITLYIVLHPAIGMYSPTLIAWELFGMIVITVWFSTFSISHVLKNSYIFPYDLPDILEELTFISIWTWWFVSIDCPQSYFNLLLL